ncbi:MAG: hypothetical protein HKN26_00360 [Acidimicrobiales bacterium]|nr:hypothetical protein [Acidimicrobiales bacterium]
MILGTAMIRRMFLVLKLARTGSTMLGQAMDGHPQIHCALELMNPVLSEDKQTKLDYFRDYYANGPGDDSGAQHGATLNPFKYQLGPDDVGDVLRDIEDSGQAGSWKLIVLIRRNKLKQATSAYLSEQRGSWESSGKNVPRQGRQTFDLWQLQSMTLAYWRNTIRLRRFAKQLGHPTMTVYYEDLAERPADEYQKIFRFLGVDTVGPDFDYTAGLTKVGNKELRDTIDNYSSMKFYPLLWPYLVGPLK